jgi:hypothetical protein
LVAEAATRQSDITGRAFIDRRLTSELSVERETGMRPAQSSVSSGLAGMNPIDSIRVMLKTPSQPSNQEQARGANS